MSTLLRKLGRLFAPRLPASRPALDPDALSVQDWADLPIHHPSCDRAPC